MFSKREQVKYFSTTLSKNLVLFSSYTGANLPLRDALTLGSKGGAVVKALASHQCGRGSNPGVDARYMWVEFVVGSQSLAPRGFSPGYLRFSPLLKNQHFQFPIRTGTYGHV